MEFVDFNLADNETPMTETSMPPDRASSHCEGDFQRAVSEAVLRLPMEHDVEGLISAGRQERSDGRLTYRNSYRDCELDMRLGFLDLRVPKLRQVTCH